MTGVLLTGAGAIGALIGAALMISAGACIDAALTIERQQRLRDPRFDFRFMVEMRNEALDDWAHVNLDVGLHRDIHLGAIVAGQSGQAIECLTDRVQAGERNFQRALLFGLSCNLVDTVAQLEIGAPRCRAPPLWRWRWTKRA